MKKVVINANKSKLHINFSELFEYRELLLLLAYRDFKARYAQTAIGILWGIFQPLVTLLIFIVIFQYVVKVKVEWVPYPIFALIGICTWNYFATVMKEAGSSMINSSHIIKKIYFPRIFLPFSKSLIAIIEYLIGILFVFALLIYYQYPVNWTIVFLPIIILLNMFASLAFGLWLNGLSIKYRDIQHTLPFITQIGLYASPVAYPISLVPKEYQTIYFLNPMAGIIELARWCIISNSPFPSDSWISFIMIFILFVTGLIYFYSVEREMADFL